MAPLKERNGFNLPKNGTCLGQIIATYEHNSQLWATVCRLDVNRPAAVRLPEGFALDEMVELGADGTLAHVPAEGGVAAHR